MGIVVWLAVFCVVANKQAGKVTFKLAAKSERGRRLAKSAIMERFLIGQDYFL